LNFFPITTYLSRFQCRHPLAVRQISRWYSTSVHMFWTIHCVALQLLTIVVSDRSDEVFHTTPLKKIQCDEGRRPRRPGNWRSSAEPTTRHRVIVSSWCGSSKVLRCLVCRQF
jgi:hypothetical protein